MPKNPRVRNLSVRKTMYVCNNDPDPENPTHTHGAYGDGKCKWPNCGGQLLAQTFRLICNKCGYRPNNYPTQTDNCPRPGTSGSSGNVCGGHMQWTPVGTPTTVEAVATKK